MVRGMGCYIARYAMGLYNLYNRMNGLFSLHTDSITNTEHSIPYGCLKCGWSQPKHIAHLYRTE
jgi:hypothetical protein